MVVLENIYRNWGNSTFSDYGTILEKTDNFNNRWSLVHLVADQFALAAEAAGLRFTEIKPSIQNSIMLIKSLLEKTKLTK
ncbi:MAG: hypothetical protein IPO65_20980 [Saprospiraceae bacterium]|nr:hypothetical protein [Saprospiraceae bacterium]